MIQPAEKIFFASDYMEGAHPDVMNRLVMTNAMKTSGYGTDAFSQEAAQKILKECACPAGEVYFLVGGTQTNATVIDGLLRPYEGVISAHTGHISIHEAGAVEASGHKVIAVPGHMGKVDAAEVKACIDTLQQDPSHEHMIMPGLLYISQPTEYGTLYTRDELQELSTVCHERGVKLYVDGARLAYALASDANDVTLADLGAWCDAFYVGGTKCGTLFGEAVVFPKKGQVPHFFTIIKQHGALLAKGRMLGVQFDELFTHDLYMRLGKPAIVAARRIQDILEQKEYRLLFRSPTNQIFVVLDNEVMKQLSEKVEFSVWEPFDEKRTIIRLVTSWATTIADVERLEAVL